MFKVIEGSSEEESCRKCQWWKQIAERNAQAFEHYKKQSAKKDGVIAELQREVESLKATVHHEPSPTVRASSSQRSINTLAKIVGGLAIAVYGYNPAESRSDAIRQIQNDLDHKGICLDADTLRKWIRKGIELLKTAENRRA